MVAPEITLARAREFQARYGVTRLADVTGLDRLGIPVYCAIRPSGLILQSTNGKGARAVDAQASALMEALDHHHAEHPTGDLRRASAKELRAEGAVVLRPTELPAYRLHTFWSDDFRIEWVMADDLLSGRTAWLPASAVYSGRVPCLHDFTANGLASGNHVVEATLHGLYELLERDAISRLGVDGRIRVAPPVCRVVRTATLSGIPADLCEQVSRSDVDLVLIAVESRIAVHTFWAALIDRAPFSPTSTVNVGYGTHLNPEVAATRAITEAAQSRLTYIHGAREDLAAKMADQSFGGLRAIAEFFDRLRPDTSWREFEDWSSADLSADYERVVAALSAARLPAVYRVELTRPPFNIPVVRVAAPALHFNRRFF
jgi:ribosomal protein S12 methylthiotransferase accessory factor